MTATFAANSRLFSCAALLALFALLFTSARMAPASAAVCTLADHIRSANTNTAVGFCPAGTSHDIITIAEDITLSEPLPPITGTITIEGGGHTISGDQQFRIFDVQGGTLMIRNLTLRDGKAERGGAIRIRGGSQVVIAHSTLANNSAVKGGAVTQTGDRRNRLTVNNSSFLNNRAEWHSGALEIVTGMVAIKNSSFQENYSDDYGGVISNSGTKTRIENSTFYNNSAKHNAGVAQVLGGEITLIHVTMVNNFLTNPYSNSGNTIARQGLSPGDSKVNLRNSIIDGRGRGQDCFGGLDQFSGNLSTDGSCAYERSGAPRLGDLTGSPAYLPLLDQSPAVDNADPAFCLERDQIGKARPQGGGCDIGAIESTTAMPAPTATPTMCTLQDQIIAANTDRAYRSCPAGNGADTIYMVRDYELSEPLAVIKTDITIEGNGHTIDGVFRFRIFDVDGGRLTINNATLTKGTGAIRLQNGGQVFVNDSSFVRNTAHSGGAIQSRFAVFVEVNNSSFIRNGAGTGGGGAISMNGGGGANIKNSSFVHNRSEYEGGAIDTVSGTLTVSNSSFIGNRARHGGAISAGGSLGSAGYVPVWLTHLTMLDNSASSGAALYLDDGPHTRVALRLRNSVIAGADAATAAQCAGRLTQNLYNLIEDGSCSPMLSGDPLMEEADESATVVAPSAGSPLIDAGYPEVCLDADQLGAPRPQGAGCDIGAIEAMLVAEASSGCVVTTTQDLNLRDRPKGNRFGIVPRNTIVVAIARTAEWFNVEYQGTTGWISAEHVRTRGVCG